MHDLGLTLVAVGFCALALTQLVVMAFVAVCVWAFYSRFVIAPKVNQDAEFERIKKILNPEPHPKDKDLGGFTGIMKYVRNPRTGKDEMVPIDEAEEIERHYRKQQQEMDEMFADRYADGLPTEFDAGVGDVH